MNGYTNGEAEDVIERLTELKEDYLDDKESSVQVEFVINDAIRFIERWKNL